MSSAAKLNGADPHHHSPHMHPSPSQSTSSAAQATTVFGAIAGLSLNPAQAPIPVDREAFPPASAERYHVAMQSSSIAAHAIAVSGSTASLSLDPSQTAAPPASADADVAPPPLSKFMQFIKDEPLEAAELFFKDSQDFVVQIFKDLLANPLEFIQSLKGVQGLDEGKKNLFGKALNDNWWKTYSSITKILPITLVANAAPLFIDAVPKQNIDPMLNGMMTSFSKSVAIDRILAEIAPKAILPQAKKDIKTIIELIGMLRDTETNEFSSALVEPAYQVLARANQLTKVAAFARILKLVFVAGPGIKGICDAIDRLDKVLSNEATCAELAPAVLGLISHLITAKSPA